MDDRDLIEGCGALFYSKSTGRFLFVLRNGPRHNGSWGIVGGKLDCDETPIVALRREITEEVGSVEYDKIVPLEKFTSENGRFVFHTYVIPVENEFVPELNDEHRGYAWTKLEDHPNPLHPGLWRSFNFRAIIDKIKTIILVF